MRVVFILVISVLSACASTPPGNLATNAASPLSWLSGCWLSDDGHVGETWVASRPGDQLFGFSVTTKDGRRVFFEMMRIDIHEAGATLSAYPRGTGPTSFDSSSVDTAAIEFVNPENDYPQRIRYARQGNELTAMIALLDGSQESRWRYRRCE